MLRLTADRNELRRTLAAKQLSLAPARSFHTCLDAFDALAPNGAFQGGAVHELLWCGRFNFPASIALLLARAAQRAAQKAAQNNSGAIAWSDPDRELYIPAAASMGIDLRQLILLRCTHRADQLWALAECLRCRGVSTTVASIERLNQIEARRLQLAAERGGGVGLFVRPHTPGKSNAYAAATRWLLQPAPGGADVQRWSVELLHGHGGQVGKVLQMEVDRETRQWRASPLPLRASAPMADRPPAPAPARTAG
jgi:protein ImuA